MLAANEANRAGFEQPAAIAGIMKHVGIGERGSHTTALEALIITLVIIGPGAGIVSPKSTPPPDATEPVP